MNEPFTNKPNQEADDTAQKLNSVASETQPNAQFVHDLETQLRAQYKPRATMSFTWHDLSPTLGWIALALVIGLLLIWSIRSFVPNPQPAMNNTPVGATPTLLSQLIPTTEVVNENTATPAPDNSSYAFRGAKLILKAVLPESPAQANVYQVKKDQPATVDEARALANQFGIQGEIYTAPGLAKDSTDYVITDGKQSLQVHSAHYFTYAADTAKALNNFVNVTDPNASSIIDEFLKSHNFDFPHKIVPSNFFGGYIVQPLAPDGLALEYESFTPPMMHVTLDEKGNVLNIDTAMVDLESNPVGTYSILSAQDALNRLVNDSVLAGKLDFVHSASGITTREWKRVYPSNETITIYGYASSTPALDSSKPPFTQIDGVTVAGNINGIESLQQNSFIAATGKFVDHNGVNIFEVDSWKLSDFQQDGLVGTLHRENGQVLLTTDQEQLTIQPDLPADVPLPFENAFVVGVRKSNNIYEWSMIDDRMTSQSGGGGGGGGGGLGFYQLNLSGTPVAFPPSTVPTQPTIPAGAGTYIVQAGDTLAAIADRFSVTVDQLVQVNQLPDPNMVYLGQTLIIPGLQSQPIEEPVTDLRGNLFIVIHKKSDGTQTREYNFTANKDGVLTSYQLQGSKLSELDAYQSMPMLISGTIKTSNGASTLLMDSYKLPFPDLKFQILKGKQTVTQINGQVITLFTDESGKTYVQISPDGTPNNMTVGHVGDEALLEALAIPDETFENYPALRVYSAAMATNPKNGQPMDFPITANQPMILDESNQPSVSQPSAQPNLIIDSVELTYFVSNLYYQVNDPMYSLRDTKYLQPVWHFHGHYEDGSEYDVIIQALKEEYLKPEIAPELGPG